MVQQLTNQINELVQQISNKISTQEIILFGSYAYGEPNDYSDIDLCIITNQNNKRKLELIRDVREAIAPIAELPVDILIYNENEFNDRASLRTTMEYKIRHEGIKIYG